MFGKTNYEIWLEKYGKEEADRRMANQRIKMSEKFFGENNPFYGKTHTEKTKEKISENLKISYSNLSKEDCHFKDGRTIKIENQKDSLIFIILQIMRKAILMIDILSFRL